MKLHEYQARQLLSDAGVPVPSAEVATTVQEAIAAHEAIGDRVVIKAQVFAGGRGKAGFVKLCCDIDETRQSAEFMLSNRMVNRQTGPEGVAVKKLLVTAALNLDKEYYVGMAIDRARGCPVIMVSTEGGVEIEEVAAHNPDAIIKEWLDASGGLQASQVDKLIQALGLDNQQSDSAAAVFRGLSDVFLKYDASLAEINPLVLTQEGRLLAIDAKVNIDDNALFRHQDMQELMDRSEENPDELRAQAAGLTYIALDGNIGCLVNGAGLAMATMDLIKLHGGEPANFLDVGGTVTTEGAIEAFRIILSDKKVKGVLVNIFGGIVNCAIIAEALITAAQEVGFNVPVVVRLEGTNVDRAKQMIEDADIEGLITAGDLTDAAQKACAAI
ncbi:MAG: ADP-forming succinate--CoA ligase subunit beta [Planctomycetota bacterium]|jgi:succinyl-CoA synthetase beta subunit